MEGERIVLRENPWFEFILYDNSFEISNTDFTYNNGVYNFSELESVSLKRAKTDWFFTGLGNLISVLTSVGQFGINKTDNRFLFEFKSGKKMEVKLIGCDILEGERLLKRIFQRISY